MNTNTPEYVKLIAALKDNILTRRYNAARLANREQLLLYYSVGAMLSRQVAAAEWGNNVLQQISSDLQTSFPGLRGFSPGNLKKMRQFYETYPDLEASLISPKPSGQLPGTSSGISSITLTVFLETFFNIGFSHHYLLITKIKDITEKWYYMSECYRQQWSYRILEQAIAVGRYNKRNLEANNFNDTLPPTLAPHALEAFKDEYLLDFINVNLENEKDLENGIVANIKAFILSLGTGFLFMGNQYRLLVGDQEFFIDLLFFNRRLQCMVALELKLDTFQPHHAGQMNFYLSALDDLVKMPNENPSIGVILCKEKNNTVVEYAIRSIDKPMGVATFQLIPPAMREVLPAPEELTRIMNAGE